MQFSELWIREWADPKCDIKALAEKLTMAGLEVDSITPVATPFTGVVVALITAIQPHPEPQYTICSLRYGSKRTMVVTAAKNLRVGQKVPLADVGAYLPALHKPGQVLEPVEVKGIMSQGMMLSLTEMGLADKATDIYQFALSAPEGEDVWNFLKLNDKIIEVDLTPNRGDCLSIRGLAREIHALTKTPLYQIKIDPITPQHDIALPIVIHAKEACPHYCSRIIRNVSCTELAPDWMREKLRRSGLRSIHPVVDILNFIMLQLGQPMHAFDLDTIESGLQVRLASEGEKLVLLDGHEVTIKKGTLLIADDKKPLALAGVMGGEASAVTEKTVHILLESAFFTPSAIAGKCRDYGIHTDSAHRFERGVDPTMQVQALERATQWILDVCGGQPGPIVEKSTPFAPEAVEILFSPQRAQALLGFPIEEKTMVQYLERLGCRYDSGKQGACVHPPRFRFDLTIEEDLVEEIARLEGYDKIPTCYPQSEMKPVAPRALSELRVKQAMVDFGFSEAITYSFVDPKMQHAMYPDLESVVLSNPMAADMAQMRLGLWPGLLKALQYNANRQQRDVFLFETGLTFLLESENLIQKPKLGAVCMGSMQKVGWSKKQVPFNFYDVKGYLESLWEVLGHSSGALSFAPTVHAALHPGQAAQVLLQGKPIGFIGAMHPSLEKSLDLEGPVFLFEVELEPFMKSERVCFEKPSVFPAIRRDLSFVVDKSVYAQALEQWVQGHAGHLLADMEFFDVYHGPGIPEQSKSIALAFTWQDKHRTLVDEDIDPLMQTLIKGLKSEFGAQIRD